MSRKNSREVLQTLAQNEETQSNKKTEKVSEMNPEQAEVISEPKRKPKKEKKKKVIEERELSIEELEGLNAKKAARREKRYGYLTKFIAILLIIACVNLVVLIIGVFYTEYIYDENGNVVPRIMSVEKLQALEEFNDIADQYRQCRLLYEKVLTLDYRIAAGLEDPLTISPEYDILLETVEDIAINLQAINPSSKYVQTHKMLLIWVKTDIAVYCQSISQAIAQNNSEAANKALEFKDIVYNDFSIITTNILTLGDGVYGAEVMDIAEWSPEKYVRENLGSV